MACLSTILGRQTILTVLITRGDHSIRVAYFSQIFGKAAESPVDGDGITSSSLPTATACCRVPRARRPVQLEHRIGSPGELVDAGCALEPPGRQRAVIQEMKDNLPRARTVLATTSPRQRSSVGDDAVFTRVVQWLLVAADLTKPFKQAWKADGLVQGLVDGWKGSQSPPSTHHIPRSCHHRR